MPSLLKTDMVATTTIAASAGMQSMYACRVVCNMRRRAQCVLVVQAESASQGSGSISLTCLLLNEHVDMHCQNRPHPALDRIPTPIVLCHDGWQSRC